MSQVASKPSFAAHVPPNDAGTDFVREESIYIESDQKLSQTLVDDSSNQENTEALSSANEQLSQPSSKDKDDAKSKRKRREEREQRLAIEQTSRLREKFNLPATEQLVGSFSAALFRTILLQGRMYITSQHICFYTKLFGKVTKEAYPFSSMARVKKRRGGFVANAIKIYFAADEVTPVIIGSLNHREKAFNLIQNRLRLINPAAAESLHTNDDDGSAGSVGSNLGENDMNVPGADFVPSRPGLAHQNSDPDSTLHLHTMQNRDFHSASVSVGSDGPTTAPNHSDSGNSSQHDSDSEAANGQLDEWEQSLVWCTPDDVVGRISAQLYDKKAERARGILNTSVKEAFNVLYMSDWLKEYHGAVNNLDVVINDWHRDEDSSMTRTVTFRRPLGLRLGPKETRVKEKQRYSFTDQGGVIVEAQGENLDVPYGNYFVVESFFELMPYGDGTQTLFVLSVSVNFLKSSILQGKIESTTLSETKTAYERLVSLAVKRVDAHVAQRSGSANRSSVSRSRASSENGIAAVVSMNSVAPLRRETNRIEKLDVGTQSRGEGESYRTNRNSNMASNRLASVEPTGGDEINQHNNNNNNNMHSNHEATPLADHETQGHAVEIHDSAQTQTFRLAAIAMLVVTFVLLIGIVVLLSRVHSLVKTLEKVLESSEQAKSLQNQC